MTHQLTPTTEGTITATLYECLELLAELGYANASEKESYYRQVHAMLDALVELANGRSVALRAIDDFRDHHFPEI